MLPQFSVFFSAAVLKIFGMKDVPLELLPVGHMESFLEIEQFGESRSTINRLLGAPPRSNSYASSLPADVADGVLGSNLL